MSIPSSSPRLYRWVESALTPFLLQVKVSLSEADASGPAGTMHRISGRFHHIQGLLEMAGLDAASLLARDLAQLSGKMADRPLTMDFDQGVICLKRGLETLQEYRFSIENQSPRSPLVLVDEMNAIRQMSGGEPVCGYDLFHPPLDCDPMFPSRGLPEWSSAERGPSPANLRERYRKALLSRLNHPEQDDSLAAMAQVMGHMQRVSRLETDQRFWWVAAGFMESFKGCRADVVSGTNVLFARLDNEMSRMQDGPVDVDDTPTNELLRKMLYFIGSAGARPCCSGQVGRIKTAFGLNQWFPEETGCSEPDRLEPLSGSMVEFSKKIDAGFFCELESRLDQYLSEKLDGESTRALCADLDTLDRLYRETGLGGAGRLIGALRSVIQDMNTDRAQLVQGGGDHRIASSVSLLKEALHDPGRVTVRWLASVAECESELYRLTVQDKKEGEAKGNSRDSTEYSRTRAALLNDIDAMLADAGTCGEAPHDLRQIEGHFNTMAGWFGNEDRMGQLSENAAGVLSRIRTRGIGLDREKKEKIALVAVSIGLGSEPLEPVRSGAVAESARKMLESLVAGIDPLDACPETPVCVHDGEAGSALEPVDDFSREREAVLSRFKAQLVQWRTHGISAEILEDIRREFLTLTSRASAAGHDEVVRLGCAVEQLLEANVGENSGAVGSSLLDVMEEVHDGLAFDLGLTHGADRDHVRTLTKIVELLLPDRVTWLEEAAADRLVDGENGAPVQNPPDMDHDMVRYADEFEQGRVRLEVALADVRQELEGLRALTQGIRDRFSAFEPDEDLPGEGPTESDRQGDCAAGPVPRDRHFPMQARIPEMIQQLERMSRVECQLSDGASDLEDILARQSALAEQLRDDFRSVHPAHASRRYLDA